MPDITPPQHPEAVTVEQTLQQAIAHHKAGQLQDAEHLYRNILKSVPSHPDANHNLGIIAIQVNQLAAGLPQFKTALEANPAQEQLTISYVEALLLNGQGKYHLYRQDDNGNIILMQTYESLRVAEYYREIFEARGHKQLYWTEVEDAD